MNSLNAPLIWPEVAQVFREKSLETPTTRRYSSSKAQRPTSDNRYYVKRDTIGNKGRVRQITQDFRPMFIRQFLTRRCQKSRAFKGKIPANIRGNGFRQLRQTQSIVAPPPRPPQAVLA